jgi:nucleoside-triphosphatase
VNGTVPVILLTGWPGVGKTTALRRIVEGLEGSAGGFYTREVRTGGRRTGFELVTLEGERALLATTDPSAELGRPVSFGRYRVDLEAIDAVGVPALVLALQQGRVVVVDEIGPMEIGPMEIGPMEIRSARFREAILKILDGEAPVVGTIYGRPQPFADRVKAHPRARVREITMDNRDALPGEVLAELHR